MRRLAWIFLSLLALSGTALAQDFGIGLGLGLFNQGGSNLHISVPTSFNLLGFGGYSLDLRVNADFVISSNPDLGLLFTPVLSYTYDPLGFTPMSLYGGPSFRLVIANVLQDNRSYAWSYVGALVGANVSLAGLVGAFVEGSFSLVGSTTVFTLQTGVGWGF